MSKNKKPLKLEDYQEASWPILEHMTVGKCPCCDEQFAQDNAPEIAAKCHPGTPVWISYWHDYIFIRCGECDKPVCRIPVSTKLV